MASRGELERETGEGPGGAGRNEGIEEKSGERGDGRVEKRSVWRPWLREAKLRMFEPLRRPRQRRSRSICPLGLAWEEEAGRGGAAGRNGGIGDKSGEQGGGQGTGEEKGGVEWRGCR